MADKRWIGPDDAYPSSIVHKLCRLVCGTKDLQRLSTDQTFAIYDAMDNVRKDGQSLSAWRNRAAGLLIQRGLARHDLHR